MIKPYILVVAVRQRSFDDNSRNAHQRPHEIIYKHVIAIEKKNQKNQKKKKKKNIIITTKTTKKKHFPNTKTNRIVLCVIDRWESGADLHSFEHCARTMFLHCRQFPLQFTCVFALISAMWRNEFAFFSKLMLIVDSNVMIRKRKSF